MTAPSDEELEQIETDGYYSVGEGSSVPAARLALYNAGYAAGLKAAREICMKAENGTVDQGESAVLSDCADAIAKLESEQNEQD